MARVETTMSVLECRTCGKLHELVYGYVEGVGNTRYLCGSDLRSYVDLYDQRHVKTVTLGLTTLPIGTDKP